MMQQRVTLSGSSMSFLVPANTATRLGKTMPGSGLGDVSSWAPLSADQDLNLVYIPN